MKNAVFIPYSACEYLPTCENADDGKHKCFGTHTKDVKTKNFFEEPITQARSNRWCFWKH